MNPFTLSFGIMPEQFIKRDEIKDKVIRSFAEGENKTNTYILTGARGAGKTVMLNYLKRQFAELDDWIVITVNPETDILESVAAKLYENGSLKRYFVKASFNFSFNGFGFSIEGDKPIKSVETLLEKMLLIVKSHGGKLLVALDEISGDKNVKIFTHTFKNMVNDGLPIYLLATGLPENVYGLQDQKTETFIYWAPKIEIKALSILAIAKSYETILNLSAENAMKCASLTEGYASAYQILGSILYENEKKDIDNHILDQFDILLAEINYDKLWEDLSATEKKFLFGLYQQKENKASIVIKNSGIDQTYYSIYRKRLVRRGVLTSSTYGYLSFALPRLYLYIKRQKELAEFDFDGDN